MPTDRYLSAAQAAETLGVSLSTLYAYVSRGLIRSESAGEGKRERRYSAEDVDKLLARKATRRSTEIVDSTALHFGAPLLDSSITLIENGELYYRGIRAAALARTHTVEQVCALIWTGNIDEAQILFDRSAPPSAERYETMLLHLEMDGADLSMIETFQAFLPLASADDLAAYDLRPMTLPQTGSRILRLMASVAAGEVPENIGIAEMLQQGWCPDDPQTAAIFNAALILSADHELNASSFTARVVASAHSTPYAVVMAGLAALQGVRHGGHTERTFALLEEVGTPDQARQVLGARLRRGEVIPGFGHKLYPDGDPRGRLLLHLLEECYPKSPELALSQAVCKAALELIGEKPTIDFGLATVARVLHLPEGAGLGLFALGRTIGLIGHAIEQIREGRLIRPRARYTGDLPPPS